MKEILAGPHQVSFDITNKCNLRCLHCYNNSGENMQSQNELSDNEVLQVIDEFKRVKLLNFCFCGGEPLLRKDLILNVCRKLKKYGCPNIAMVTNGVLLNEHILKELMDAGMNRIQVSLDGIKKQSHDKLRNKKNVYEKAINAIELVAKTNMELSIAFTPTSFNVNELNDIHNYLASLNKENIKLRVQPLMILGRATKNMVDILPSNAQYRKLVREINKINLNGIKPIIDWGDPIDHLIRLTNLDIVINTAVIRANGDIVVDPYLPLVIGNLRRHSLLQYWEKGMPAIWKNDFVSYLANEFLSIKDMGRKIEKLPKVWEEEDILIDLIDDNFEELSQKYLNKICS